ncbi:partial ADP-dependent (S)-NAD(P)H-hydrate dehydratase, partial [Candidatus Brocadiaceae bacterium]
LIGVPSQEIKKDMLAYGLSFVRDTESYLVLKGPRTIIFTPYEEIFINTTGNPGMAKFGSGDVLTGVLAGMMSQSILVTEALLAGVYIHSLTGDILAEEYTEYGFVASDLVKGIPSAIKFLRNKFDPIVKE